MPLITKTNNVRMYSADKNGRGKFQLVFFPSGKTTDTHNSKARMYYNDEYELAYTSMDILQMMKDRGDSIEKIYNVWERNLKNNWSGEQYSGVK